MERGLPSMSTTIQSSEKPSRPSALSIERSLLLKIRLLLLFFIFGLFISGATAIPLQTELQLLASWSTGKPGAEWFLKVRDALNVIYSQYPFIAYGTDWLAFAHFVLAILFIGPLRDPIKNIWVIQFGMIACALVIPFALIMGPLRGIPFPWRLIDCSFGIFGIIPLWLCQNMIKRIQLQSVQSTEQH
jgi:hypothetical protein